MTNNLDFFKNLTLKTSRLQKDAGDKKQNSLHPFDKRNIHPEIELVAKKLFDDGHYSHSTFEAFKYLDKEVARVSKVNDSGFKLMMNAFAEKMPLIKLTNLVTTSEIDEQSGFKFIFAGAASAIRNPRGHEVGNLDNLEACLDHLSFASFLVRRLKDRAPHRPVR